MTLHAVVADAMPLQQRQVVKKKIREIVASHGKIHVTIDIECESEDCPNANCVKC